MPTGSPSTIKVIKPAINIKTGPLKVSSILVVMATVAVAVAVVMVLVAGEAEVEHQQHHRAWNLLRWRRQQKKNKLRNP